MAEVTQVMEPNPNHQRHRVADEEDDPMDRDLAEDSALDFGINKGFPAFGGRAGH